MIKAIIIDDEQLARDIIKAYLADHHGIEIVGECTNGFEGLKAINEIKPDLVFLDIMMPKITGFEMLELLDDAPVIIFSTAYDEYAIKAFELSAADYLLKPYTKERFDEAVNKAVQRMGGTEKEQEKIRRVVQTAQEKVEQLERVVVKVNSKIHILSVNHIRHIEAMDDYVRIHTEGGSFLKQQTMKYLESHLDKKDFIRVHRSHIVSVSDIEKIELLDKDSHVCMLKSGGQLPVSRSGYSRLKEVLDF
ncbi:MAG: LytTR family transcriptional regulator DNA-binding domain-containing protein [Cyclobacteriaceae bacterium]